MCMDGMKVKRQMRSALSQCEDVNTSDDATTDCVQCAQCCMVSSSACVASFTNNCSHCAQRCWECAWSCTHCSVAFCHIYVYLFVNFWFRMYCIYKKYHWLFNVCPWFRPCVSWKTWPYVWTFWLKNFEQSRSVPQFYWSISWYGVSCLSVTIW